ncbi:MAG: HAMP domain-containing protein [Mycobacteriaceae bacterium]|nr:HAMP domain-containing protein [Mycobacteriaceae bacterium]
MPKRGLVRRLSGRRVGPKYSVNPGPEEGAVRAPGSRFRLPFRVGIQSKLLVMLLVCSIMSVSVVGVIGFQAGRTGLRDGVAERLVELCQLQKRAVESLFADLTNSLIGYSHGFTAVDAVKSFAAGFDQLSNATINPDQRQAIVNYYTKEVIAPIERITGTELDIKALLPSSPAQNYLQAYYTASLTSQNGLSALDGAGDGSAWSAANIRFNDFFRMMITRFNYKDVLLLDAQGDVVYTAMKGPELGTNILTGPYRESNLRDAYLKALGSNAVDFVWITDFQLYQPQRDMPTAWLVAPLGANGRPDGVIALPLPITKINSIMTADEHWTATGMGATTETYLAGPDNLMRSVSRLFLENPQEYQREAVAAGTAPDVVEKAIRLGGTTLVQPVPSAGLRAAQRGQTGVINDTDYLGHQELEAYAPLAVPNSDLHWSILATREDSAAFAHIESFSRTLVLAIVAMILVICVASMLLAQLVLRPIRRLEAGTQKISSGDYQVSIPVVSRDEFGDLTAAFNEMSRNLGIKEAQLNEQRKENDRLLLSLMPESVVARYREGEHTIAQEHQDVTVVFAVIVGLEEISTDMSGDELVGMVDELFRQFSSAADALGVERIRTFHNGYLASCGLTTPRLDSIHRTVEFALEMRHIIDRFNSQNDQHLQLRVGINTGDAISGLVGRAGLVYDMWGSAVNLAYHMHSDSSQPGIYVSARIYEAMRGIWKFARADTITVSGSPQQIWRLSERQ